MLSNPPMTIVACVKFTVDVNALRPDPETRRPDLSRAPVRISDFDENAIEEAVRLKEKHGGKTIGITVVSDPPPREVVLKALAMGLDELNIVRYDGPLHDPAIVSALLASVIRRVPGWSLVLCGEGSVDEYNSQTAPRLAEILGVPGITYTQRVELGSTTVRADRVLEDRVETVECPLPAVLSVTGEINTPRLPSVLQIMAAGRRPVVETAARDLEGSGGAAPGFAVHQLDAYAPPGARKRIPVEGESPDEVADALARALAAEGILAR